MLDLFDYDVDEAINIIIGLLIEIKIKNTKNSKAKNNNIKFNYDYYHERLNKELKEDKLPLSELSIGKKIIINYLNYPLFLYFIKLHFYI